MPDAFPTAECPQPTTPVDPAASFMSRSDCTDDAPTPASLRPKAEPASSRSVLVSTMAGTHSRVAPHGFADSAPFEGHSPTEHRADPQFLYHGHG